MQQQIWKTMAAQNETMCVRDENSESTLETPLFSPKQDFGLQKEHVADGDLGILQHITGPHLFLKSEPWRIQELLTSLESRASPVTSVTFSFCLL